MAGPVDHAAAAYPAWLGHLVVPTTVVAGPPGNGARAWIDERAGEDDLVLDLAEIIAELAGVPSTKADSKWVVTALERRNVSLRRLTRALPDTPAAWLIAPAPAAWQREFWTRRGATLVVLDPGITAATIAARDEGVAEAHVQRWYQDANYRQPSRGMPVAGRAFTAAPKETTASRGYGRDHGKLRDEQLAREPHCRFCAEVGRTTRATVLDHIEPFRRADGSFDGKRWGDPKNHRSLCGPCHDARGATRSRPEKAPGTGQDGRPLDPSHPWNRK